MFKKAITGTLLYCLTYGNTQAAPVELNINIEGSGQLTVASTGEVCNSSCVLTVDNTEAVEMLATTDESNYVSSWGGICPAEQAEPWAPKMVKIAESLGIASRVSAIDLNGDDSPDLAMLTMLHDYTQFVVALNKGDGTFHESKEIFLIERFMSDIKTVDWDRDGDQDVLLVNYDDRVIYVYHNDGEGNFTLNNNITLASRAVSIAIADINNDGNYDFLVNSFNGIDMIGETIGAVNAEIRDSHITWFINDGDDTFTRGNTISTDHKGVLSLHVADYDNDGDLDAVAAGYSGKSFYLLTNENGIYTSKNLQSDAKAYGINFGDVNNDGLLDIVAVDREGRIHQSIQKQDNTYPTFNTILTYHSAALHGIDVADIDLDGDNDLVIGVFESSGPYYVLENKMARNCTVDTTNNNTVNVTFSSKTLVADSSDDNTDSELTANTTGNNTDSGGSTDFKWLIALSIFLALRTIVTKHSVNK